MKPEKKKNYYALIPQDLIFNDNPEVEVLSSGAIHFYGYLKTHNLEKYSPNYFQMEKSLRVSHITIVRWIRELEKFNLIMTTTQKTKDNPKGAIRISWINNGELK